MRRWLLVWNIALSVVLVGGLLAGGPAFFILTITTTLLSRKF